jgi:hypothetical protein
MGIFLDHRNIEGWPVGDNFLIITIEDVAPWRSQLSDPDSVAISSVFIFLSITDLEKPESQNNDNQEKNDDDSRRQQPPF